MQRALGISCGAGTVASDLKRKSIPRNSRARCVGEKQTSCKALKLARGPLA